jgi:zinc protease
MVKRLHSMPGPEDIHRTELANGIVLLVRVNPSSPSVVIGGYLACGSLFDPDEKLGLADFTASALLRGTQRQDFQQIFESLESAGANLSFSAGVHTAGFTGRSLAEDLPLLLGLLSDALRTPVFPHDQVERLRAQLLTGLAMRAQDTAEMASLTFDQIVFKGHPYERPDAGWPETVQAIARADLVEFHRRHYGPGGMVISVVGGIDPQRVVELVERALGEWTNPGQPAAQVVPAGTPLKKTISRKFRIAGKSQSDLVVGSLGPYRKAPDFLAASLGNSALGQFGLGGRIGEVVREKSGLAYYAYSSLNAGIGPGSWDVSAGVNPANVHKTRELILGEIRRFIEHGVQEQELADSQSNFIGRLPLSMESNAGLANALLNIERYELGLDYYLRYPDLVRAVTPAQVLDTARNYLHPDRLAVAVAGP